MSRSRAHTRRKPRSHPRGVLVVRTEGFGFVQTSEGAFFIPRKALGGAFDGDVVEVAPIVDARRGARTAAGRGSNGNPAARVVRVVERAHEVLIGRYEVAEPFGVVIPEDPRIPYDIFTRRSDAPQVPDGALVRVRIVEYPTRTSAATGVVEEVLAEGADARAGVEVVIARHKLETSFSPAALEEAASARLDAVGALAEGYRDLRDRFVFTIDPEDAKDFDDALSICSVGADAPPERVDAAASPGTRSSRDPGGSPTEVGFPPAIPRTSGTRETLADLGSTGDSTDSPAPDGASLTLRTTGGSLGAAASSIRPLSGEGWEGAGEARWRLGVYIADVAHYVPWNSSIDFDARRRATSVYLVDRVIPMLPPELSEDLCSLRPGEERRTLTVDLFLDARGRLVRYEIYPALIRSHARLSYGEAQRLIERASDADAAADVASRVRTLARLGKLREGIRTRCGAIDFSVPEAKVRLDDEGRAVEITLREKNAATRLVEQAMILANEAVARAMCAREWPCVFRVHERPSASSLASLVPVLEEFPWFTDELGVRLARGEAAAIQEALAASRTRAEGELVSSLLLRAMKRAVYRPAREEHYGLASAAYCHFTSPIRRYPDLVVHRMLHACLTRRPRLFDQEVAALPWIAEHASDAERVADDAARESQELKMIEYLEQYVGTSFSGVVSGVAQGGLFVRLECTAEGFLPVRALGDEYFAFDAERHALTGEETGRRWRLGQRIAVTLRAADAQAGTLAFSLACGSRP